MNWEILLRYIDGSCSRQELRQLGEWLDENPANEDFFKTFIEHSNLKEDRSVEVDARVAWEQFKKTYKIPSQSESIDPVAPLRKKDTFSVASSKANKRSRLFWYSAAAAAVVFLAVLFFVEEYTGDQNNSGQIVAQEIATSKGQRTNLKLSDGTLVTLNSDSRLKIPGNFGSASRIIYLEGEAFFDVSHDEELSFQVISPQGYVTVLGTVFNVMAYNSDKLEVAVKEGLVSLGEVEGDTPQKELVKLSPNKLGILKHSGEYTVSDIHDIDLFTGWAEGKLVFKDTPFVEVVRRLERWFDVECIIENSHLEERTLTATYDKMPLSEVLEVLSASLHVSYEREKRTVIFSDDND